MEPKNSLTINLDTAKSKEFIQYCQLNKLDPEQFVTECFLQGYYIEKNGLIGKTGGIPEKQVEKEVIVEKRVEIPVEVIKEVEVVKEIPIEVIKERSEERRVGKECY
jgi:hypothetical protein